MSANEIHVGDIGTRVTLTFKDGTSAVDISGASTKQVWFRSPSGTAVKLSGVFTTDGSDGKLYFDSVTNTFSEAGEGWEVQGYVVTATGTWHSDKTTFRVYANADRA